MLTFRSGLGLSLLVCSCSVNVSAQCLMMRAMDADPQAVRLEIPLIVPSGTPLRVALPERVRVRRPGEPVKATVTHPVYAFDQVVIPAGSELVGQITRINPISRKRRILASLLGDFTPARDYGLAFDSLVLPDGRQLPIKTQVSPGIADVVRLVSDSEREKKGNPVARTVADAKQQVSGRVKGTVASIKSPGRIARLKRYLTRQLPLRRQYIESGTRFDAVLDEPLDFGAVTRTEDQLSALGAAPSDGGLLEARLANEVTSATAQRGTPVEAIVTAPVFSAEQKLVFPANSRLVGEVIDAKPARKFRRHGRLRVAFQRIELPDGLVQTLPGSLAAVEADRDAGLKLDNEGGAQATSSRTRYLSTALALAATAMAAQRDGADPGELEGPETNVGAQTVAGGLGLRLVGAASSLAMRQPVFATVIGTYATAFSIHRNFLARGREVTLPRDTRMEITFGKPHQAAATKARQAE